MPEVFTAPEIIPDMTDVDVSSYESYTLDAKHLLGKGKNLHSNYVKK